MVGPVTGRLGILDIVALFDDFQVIAGVEQVNDPVDVIDKLAHDPDTGNVLHVGFDHVRADDPPLHFLFNGVDRFHPANHEFYWRMLSLDQETLPESSEFNF